MGNNDGLDGYRQELREEIEEHRGDVQEQLRGMRLHQQELGDKMDEVLDAVGDMGEKVGKMDEMLTAWNNAKGFVNTVQMISKVIKFLTPIGLLILAGWYFIKTGHLPPSK